MLLATPPCSCLPLQTNFVVIGMDDDGSSATAREYIDIGGFSSVVLDANTLITIQTGTAGRVRFLGGSANANAAGVAFDDTASFGT